MSRFFRATALLTLAGLAGCMVGPDYKRPSAPAGATAPLVSLRPAAETAALPPDDWWRLYNDPRLDGYLQEAFAANTDLAAAEANLSGARAELEAARSGLYPSTSVSAGAIYGRDPTLDEIIEVDGGKPFSVWTFDDLLDASYELDLFGRVRRSIEAARDQAQAVAAARDDLKITIAAETTRAYAEICTLGERIGVARHSVALVARQAEITAQRYAAGGASEFDVVRVQGEVAQVQAEIPPLEGQRRAALFELASLLGRTPARAPEEALACTSAPVLGSLIPVGDGASLIRRRPDVREAERRLAAATAEIGVATADLYPRISLTGQYGSVGTQIKTLGMEPGLTWGVGPTISWAFPNQIAPRARIKAAKASTTAALDTFDGAVLRALKETETALAAYGSELDRHQALADAQADAHKAFQLAHGQLLAGSLSTLDLLTTEQTMVSADAAIAASDAGLVQDQIAVFKALGGGWQGK
jgi:NodT family efflux transporter outer membrane factor (OMF) lipoprotein